MGTAHIVVHAQDMAELMHEHQRVFHTCAVDDAKRVARDSLSILHGSRVLVGRSLAARGVVRDEHHDVGTGLRAQYCDLWILTHLRHIEFRISATAARDSRCLDQAHAEAVDPAVLEHHLGLIDCGSSEQIELHLPANAVGNFRCVNHEHIDGTRGTAR